MSESPAVQSPTGAVNPPPTDAPPVELPADHPLVKTLAAQKAEIKALKEKANRLDELESAQKSAEEKAAEREAAAEKRAADAEARAARREVALEHKLSTDDAALLDAVSDETAMRALAARLAKQAEGKTKSNHVPNEGKSQPASTDERRAFVRQLTGRE